MSDFAYSRPGNLAEALALLQDPAALPLSGGQTLLPVLRARLSTPDRLVDLAHIPALKGITLSADTLRIGGAETHATIATHPLVQQALPALAALAGGIGDPQVRNRGTLGGSIANNDPAACYPAAMLALDAAIETDRRTIPAADFFTGLFTTALMPGELVTAVHLSPCPKARYLKFANPASRFALIGVFVAWTDAGTRIAFTGAGAGVFRWHEAENWLTPGGNPEALKTLPLNAAMFNGDLHGSAAYRQNIARVVTARALALGPVLEGA